MLREIRGAMFLLIEWEYEIITIFAKYFAQNNIPTEKLTLTPLKTFLERLRNFHHLAARCWSREYFFPGIIYQHPGAVLILSALIDSNCYAIFFFLSCRMSLRQRAERARLNMVSRLGRAIRQNVLHQMRVCPSKYPSECARDISSSEWR